MTDNAARVTGQGPKLRLSRVYVGMNPVQMADLLKVPKRQYVRWEKGDTAIPRNVLGEVQQLVEKFDELIDGFLDQTDVRLPVGDPDDLSTMAAAIAVMERPELEPYRPHPVNDRDAFLLLARSYMAMTPERMMSALGVEEPRLYRAWELGDRPLPGEVRVKVDELLDKFEDLIDSFIDRDETVVVVRRDDYPVLRALSLAARERPELTLMYEEEGHLRVPLHDPVAVEVMASLQRVKSAVQRAELAVRARKSGVDPSVFDAVLEAAQEAVVEARHRLAETDTTS